MSALDTFSYKIIVIDKVESALVQYSTVIEVDIRFATVQTHIGFDHNRNLNLAELYSKPHRENIVKLMLPFIN